MQTAEVLDYSDDESFDIAGRARPQVEVVPDTRANRQIQRAVALAILQRGSSGAAKMDVELVGVNIVCERWAVSVGIGLPTDLWDDNPRARPVPLDDDTAILVDQIILRSPERVRIVVRKWYKTPTPVSALSREFRISQDALYILWRASLFYLRDQFRAVGIAV